MRKAICAAIIRGGKILLVQKEDFWILPGGKPEFEESDEGCLVREVAEELSGAALENIKYFGSFVGKTPRKGDQLRAEVFLADISGKALPSAEIHQAVWIANPKQYNLSDITEKIVEELFSREYLKVE